MIASLGWKSSVFCIAMRCRLTKRFHCSVECPHTWESLFCWFSFCVGNLPWRNHVPPAKINPPMIRCLKFSVTLFPHKLPHSGSKPFGRHLSAVSSSVLIHIVHSVFFFFMWTFLVKFQSGTAPDWISNLLNGKLPCMSVILVEK